MQFNKHMDYEDIPPIHTRQYRLIRFITTELIIVCVIISLLYTFLKLWYLVAVISISGILVLINFWVLTRTLNTKFCGHAITIITFLTIIIANYLVRGIGPSYSQWFYVIPLLAASLVGWNGMLIYSICSLCMIVSFGSFSIEPFYHLPSQQLNIIDWMNRLFAYLIIITALSSLLREKQQYERVLIKKKYLLQTEKDKYYYLARFDQLTNLPNREYFTQHLQNTVNTISPDYCITVFFMDLDKFKEVNDNFGHEVGDHLLLQTARRLQISFREGDFIARLGGDEFTAIVVHSRNEKIPKLIVNRIMHEFSQSIKYGDMEYYCSISIGLATYPEEAQTVSELMGKADLAMYAAKKKEHLYRKTTPGDSME